jgi:uncharacterized protein
MEIKRTLIPKLLAWKNSKERKPLILQGARQTGKTWILKKLGRDHFDDMAYFNFEKQPELSQFFEITKDPKRIIENLTLLHGKPIYEGKTLIIFDEIQECNSALNSLKYFKEEAPGYIIACAGSLLGVALSRGASFPVGKVDFIQVHPLTFDEFLAEASGDLWHYINQIHEIGPIPDIFFSQLAEKLKIYFLTGGMPEAVVALIKNRDIEQVQNVLQNILDAYRLDFSKHVDTKNIPKINFIWDSLPSQLARENRKFLYQTIKPGARAREYEDALLWLINAGLAYKIHCISKPAIPLSAYRDLGAFKIYMSDVGLLRRLSQLDPIAIKEGNRLFTEFKGALTENFILTSILTQFEGLPSYWRSGNRAEVDFILQQHNEIIPVEVKSDENVRSKSLSLYRNAYNPALSIRFSMRNLKFTDGLLNIPLFLADHTARLMELNIRENYTTSL